MIEVTVTVVSTNRGPAHTTTTSTSTITSGNGNPKFDAAEFRRLAPDALANCLRGIGLDPDTQP